MAVNIWTPERLRAFTGRVAETYDDGGIHAPVHLSAGNEERLIAYFETYFRPGDWVFATWRSHYAALLTGLPEEQVFDAILAGRSITLCFPEYRFATSAIVAGHLPIAVGVAMGIARDQRKWWEIKRAGASTIRLESVSSAAAYEFVVRFHSPGDAHIVSIEEVRKPHVHCFLGDMAAETGLFHECKKYAIGHNLPITFIVEDNGLSVCTPTREVWGSAVQATGSGNERGIAVKGNHTFTYSYHNPYPHSGAGKRVNF